jgi:catechol 2,3-dioxygenase-like lactoylglutathione lyase family enzyme
MGLEVQITFDCADADRMQAFWSEVLGYHEEPPPTGFATWPEFLIANNIAVADAGAISACVDPDGRGPRLLFLRVPEGKTAKNRVHLDVRVTNRAMSVADRHAALDAKAAALVALGATPPMLVDEDGGFWLVMHDPEGNEFCLT